jgi:CBS domain-containing protein
MASEVHNPVKTLLHETLLKDMLPVAETAPVTVKDNDTIEELVFALSENKIISAPVVNKEGTCVGVVDMLDVISHVISVSPLPSSLERDELQSLEICGRAMALEEVSKILNASGRDPFVPVYEESPSSMISDMFAEGTHRVPILDSADQVLHTVSQSDIVRFLSEHIHMGHCKEVGELDTDKLGLGKEKVVSVDKTTKVLDAMIKIRDTGVSAVAVVDESEGGKLCGNFSATDLKALFKETFPSLLLSVEDYLAKHSPKSSNPVCVSRDLNLIGIIKELQDNHIHRVWILDDDYKPEGVISMTDIFKIVKFYHTS